MQMQIPIPGIIINGPQGPRTLELVEPRGGGAFGVVFKAVDLTDGWVFAVKFPQSAVFGGNAELAAFFNEVSAAQEISHPNVVKIVHVETQPDELPPYLVMEFIAGGTLQSVLTRISAAGQQVDVDHLRLWATGLIEGIAAINEKMLHRDLKPDNILMDGDVPKISDFGLSKIVGALTSDHDLQGRSTHPVYGP